MAGRPKTRAKKIARGECVCPASGCPVHKTELARAAAADNLPEPETPEWDEMLERAREEREYLPPPRTVAEAEAYELNQLLPDAYAVLREQLHSEDERVRQKAAIEIIDRVKGKAAQTVKTVGEQVHTIRYESAAWTWGKDVIDKGVVEHEPLELEEAS